MAMRRTTTMTRSRARFEGGAGQPQGQDEERLRSKKMTNIVEGLDVGLPLRTTYDTWTQFADFPIS